MSKPVLLVAVAVALSAACGGSPEEASIVGRGNPCTGPGEPKPGYVLPVTLKRSGQVFEVRQVAGPDYTFTFRVDPGEYEMTAPGSRPVKPASEGEGKCRYPSQ
jgi:hypothetical protein